MNTVAIAGNLTRDPELRFLNDGTAVANLGVAVSRRWFDKNKNDWTEETSFFDVSAWRQQAENAAESFKKGDRVVVVGRLEQRSWEGDNGEKRSKVEIRADEISASTKFGPTQAAPKAPAYDSSDEPF